MVKDPKHLMRYIAPMIQGNPWDFSYDQYIARLGYVGDELLAMNYGSSKVLYTRARRMHQNAVVYSYLDIEELKDLLREVYVLCQQIVKEESNDRESPVSASDQL